MFASKDFSLVVIQSTWLPLPTFPVGTNLFSPQLYIGMKMCSCLSLLEQIRHQRFDWSQSYACRETWVSLLATCPPNLNITLIINKNSSLDITIHVNYSARSSRRRERARNLKFKYLSERRQPTPIFSDPKIFSDLYRSQWVPDRRLGGGQAAPLPPPTSWRRLC